jgi:predicted XRE-type DNA-binding protein
MNEVEESEVYRGSGNVFADMGLENAEELQTKSTLSLHISRAIRRRHLTQKAAAEILGVDQPKVSNLLRGRLDGFSTDRLLRFLVALDQDVSIVIAEKPADQARPARLQVQTDPRAA